MPSPPGGSKREMLSPACPAGLSMPSPPRRAQRSNTTQPATARGGVVAVYEQSASGFELAGASSMPAADNGEWVVVPASEASSSSVGQPQADPVAAAVMVAQQILG